MVPCRDELFKISNDMDEKSMPEGVDEAVLR
jgi:hypothetical protein